MPDKKYDMQHDTSGGHVFDPEKQDNKQQKEREGDDKYDATLKKEVVNGDMREGKGSQELVKEIRKVQENLLGIINDMLKPYEAHNLGTCGTEILGVLNDLSNNIKYYCALLIDEARKVYR